MKSNEAKIEHELIEKLVELKYRYRPDIRDRAALEANFKQKFEALNNVQLSDPEFQRLLQTIVTPDVFQAAKTLREINSMERDDGTTLNYTLVNIKDWCKNEFEVINQLRINTDNSHHRYDVLLLINGVPVTQIELKNGGVTDRKAMQQIVEYKSDPGNGYGKTLLCFVQLFIVSNRVQTRYFANNNPKHFAFDANERFLPVYVFADKDNRRITHLHEFADAFLAKCTLGRMISRYMVLVASEQKLMMMRPYQIYAVQAIMDCIQHDSGNGYIWHTTGSGKTLTSFKASTLLKDNPNIDKCLFVVDRKDLDRQTREEFNRFQEGCVEENTNTETLVQRLLSEDYADKVIVTTIQKLGLALSEDKGRNYRERLAPLANKRIAFIFDECHRSQFGDNHQAIVNFFPRAQLFGFTGTPIFEQNATAHQVEGQVASYKTTELLFQKCLHQYTITHAIEDGNVLRFHIDYYKPEGENPPPPGSALPKDKVIETILEKHDAATNHRKFNAILATASINDAIEYWRAFRDLQNEDSQGEDTQHLNIAAVFSPPAEGDRDVRQLQEDLPQEALDNKHNPEGKKAALIEIIADYNRRFGTNHHIHEFDLYYQDVQKRIKDQQYPNSDLSRSKKIDVIIVVDMLLTGFDSKYLNTLYVDKNLKYHGLIQAFSRTNRVLNETKPYGQVLDFRQQQARVDEAIALFSGATVTNPTEIWLVDPAPVVIERFEQATQELTNFMESQGLSARPADVGNLRGDAARSQFVNLFKEVQRCRTQLEQYTDLSPDERTQIEAIVPFDDMRDYKAMYIETAQALKEVQQALGDDASLEVQQLDFEFVLFSSTLVDYDYIMGLVSDMTHEPAERLHLQREQLIGIIRADSKFIHEHDDIAEFIRDLPAGTPYTVEQIQESYEAFREAKKNQELLAIADKHGIDRQALQGFIQETTRRKVFDAEALRELVAPLGLGWRDRAQKESEITHDLRPILDKMTQGQEISGIIAFD